IPLAPWIKIHDLEARTIQPNGSISELTSKPFEKVIFKNRDFKFLAETFTLPNVLVGTIIEYRFRLQSSWIHSNQWILEHDLFTVREHFLFKHAGPFAMSFAVSGSTAKPEKKNETYELELTNVPPFRSEEQMPPAENYKTSVQFFYGKTDSAGVRGFWTQKARSWSLGADNFIGYHREIRDAAAAAIGSATDPEEKLRKLYARVQEVRNLYWERERSASEEKKEQLKENNSVVDVLKRGYGNSYEISALFVAMARAAGFNASLILVAGRERRFFRPEFLDSSQYNWTIAGVTLQGKNLLLDPATKFCPFGLVRWANTATSALKIEKDTWNFMIMPSLGQDRAVVLRTARVALDDQGSLKGHVTVTFEGNEALERRLLNLQTDEAGRNKALEDEVTSWLPPQSTAKMNYSKGWQETGGTVLADLEIEVPSYAAKAGKRLLLPSSLFPTRQKGVFRHADRKYPVYFPYAFSELDLTVIKMPAGYTVETIPEAIERKPKFGMYRNSTKISEDQIVNTRGLFISQFIFEPAQYSELKEFFEKVATGDQFQTVLSSTTAGKL
ncbi:MAG TPA: transglutaminase domain-containing protein, partial [Candidatus Binatia bacterium]|nr:transglutaminase domain-containing protein [Candidatus Binatia bacterium]